MDKGYFKEQRKIYILSDSYNGTDNIRGNYLAIDDTGKVLYHQTCTDKKFAKGDLILKNKKRMKKISEEYGNDFKILFLGDDNMTLDKLVYLHNKNYPN